MRVIKKGATSQSIYVEILDSASTTGGRKTGIAFNTASLVGSYTRNGATRTAITLATQTASGAYSSGGFVEVDATNVPGLYRLDVPDAALAAGSGDSVVITLKGAAGMVQVSEEIQLAAVDLQDATAFGVSRIDAAVTSRMATFTLPTNFASLSIDGSGRVDLSKWLGSTPNALLLGRVDSMVAIEEGQAQSGTSVSIVLRTGAPAVDNIFQDQIVAVYSGTGSGQARRITSYNGTTKEAFIEGSWIGATPTSSSFYVIIPFGSVHVTSNTDKTSYSLAANAVDSSIFTQSAADRVWSTAARALTSSLDPTAAAIKDAVLNEPTSGHTTAGSVGKAIADAAAATTSPWDTLISGHTTGGTFGAKLNGLSGAGGTGSQVVTLTTSPALSGVEMWVTLTNDPNASRVAQCTTGTSGTCVVNLDPGVYWLFSKDSGYKSVGVSFTV